MIHLLSDILTKADELFNPIPMMPIIAATPDLIASINNYQAAVPQMTDPTVNRTLFMSHLFSESAILEPSSRFAFHHTSRYALELDMNE